MFKQTKFLLIGAVRHCRVFAPCIVLFVFAVLFTACDSEIIDGKIDSEMSANPHTWEPEPAMLLASGLQGAAGSTVGPGHALFVTEGAAGKVSRIDPKTGNVSTFAEGLPAALPWVGIGGAYDVAFIGSTAYVLVTLVGADVGGVDIDGIYRIDGPDSYTIIADIGAFAAANPPETDFFLPMGVQYSLEFYRGGFLVTDGHHNRVYQVTTEGEISVFKSFENIVPTGLDVMGDKIFIAEAGPIPHAPSEGKIVSFSPYSPDVYEVATGAPLLVDVEFSRGVTLYGLSQGTWDGVANGSPAEPNTGSLVRVNPDGSFTAVTDGLDRPTSMEFIKNTAYVVTLTGQVWTIDSVGAPPFGM